MQLLLQKQRNRGQDGAGLATIKLDAHPGKPYIDRYRTNSPQYLKDLFQNVFSHYQNVNHKNMSDGQWLKEMSLCWRTFVRTFEIWNSWCQQYRFCASLLRQNNWITRNLVLAGNFNLTNVEELFQELIELGQYPIKKTDTVTVLEKMGHFWTMKYRSYSIHLKQKDSIILMSTIR